MTLECSICISAFKDPVCLPCGHVYCKKCIIGHVNVPTNMGMTSTCPDCRSTFHTVIPDLTYLPEKYHPFVSPAVRRVYIDVSSHASLQKKLGQAEKQIDHLRSKEAKLQNRNELLANALSTSKEKVHELEKAAQVHRKP
ncbi:hypothetical protein BJ912DRAFT_441979 [Pholiota molesta]|nr:hypothetical protein BJ912DRAFT_441979 [Pholiota molesta]